MAGNWMGRQMLLNGATSEGKAKKVAASAGKIAMRHSPLGNLDMSAMTMQFRVHDPAMLTQI
ncbi:copper-binding protein [Cupriavidus metallidurans]